MVAPAAVDPVDAFAGSRVRFEAVVSWLESAPAHALSHGELEQQLQVDAASCSGSCCRSIWICGPTPTPGSPT